MWAAGIQLGPTPCADVRLCAPLQCKEDGGLEDFLEAEQLALWPLSRGNRDAAREAGCTYGSLKYGWDLRAKLHPRIPMEDLIADALERVRPATRLLWKRSSRDQGRCQNLRC